MSETSQTTLTPTEGEGDVASTTASTLAAQLSEANGNSTTMQTSSDISLSLTSTDEPGTQHTQTSSPPPALGVGPAVGVGLGSAVAGGLIVLAIFLLCLRKKQDRPSSELANLGRRPLRVSTSEHTSPPTAEHSPTTTAEHMSTTTAALDHIAQPLTKDVIESKLDYLNTDIKNFVDNCFSYKKILIDADGEAKIQALAGEPPLSSTWAEGLSSPSRNNLIIRAMLSQALFKSINPRSEGGLTLLPPVFKDAYKSLLTSTRLSRSGRHDTSDEIQLLSWWRQISGHFHSRRDSISQSHVERAMETFEAAIAPLHPRHENKHQHNMRGLLTQTANLGWSLFQQPYEWQAVWATSSSYDRVVVFPGLVFLSAGQPRSDGHGYETENLKVYAAVIRG